MHLFDKRILKTVNFQFNFLLIQFPCSCVVQNGHYDTDKTYISSIVGDRVARQHDPVLNGKHDDYDEEYYKDDSSRSNDKENDEIKLYEGWNPVEYE